VAAYHRRAVPHSYALLCADVADACDLLADELAANRMAEAARPALLAVAEATGRLERTNALAVEVVLAMLRSVIVDLLELSGMETLEATDALPPPGG